MRRRQFLAGVAGAAIWAITAHAQQPERMRHLGVMIALAESDPEGRAVAVALREGLQQFGWTEGRNITTHYRWGIDNPERSLAAARNLLALSPDVIMPATTQMMGAVRQETTSVPIVFVNISDPVGTGFVESLARPGSNATGFTNFEYAMAEKWLQTLKEIAPSVTRTAVIANPKNPNTALYLRAIEPAATSLGMKLIVTLVNEPAEIERTITAFARESNGGLLIMPDPLTIANRELIVALAAQHHLPVAYPYRFFVTSGGLLSYGTDRSDIYRRAASYVDRVLKGANAGDLPVQPPTKFELVINLKTANALGLTIPPSLLARADEVIE